MIKIVQIWFENNHMFGKDDQGNVYCQSILWYRRLLGASLKQLSHYELSINGIHWPELDEDISFDSFIERNNVEPSSLQAFFLTHREINLAEFAKTMGINGTLLRNYVYGWKTPSQDRINEIVEALHRFGNQLLSA